MMAQMNIKMRIFRPLEWLIGYAKIRRNQYRPLEELRNGQWKRLKVLLRHAYKSVPYYRRLFRKAEITPDDIKTFKDMEKIPLTDKHSIRTAYPNDMIARGYTEKDYIHDQTSGSSGIPLQFVVDKKALMIEGLVGTRANYNNIKIKWSDKMVYFAPETETYKLDKWSGLRKTIRMITNTPVEMLTISPWLDAEEQIKILERYQPDTIRAYASDFKRLIIASESRDIKISPRICCSTSESLFEDERRLFEEKFNTRLFRVYGSREFGELAGECYEEKNYHMNIDGYLFEFVKDGKQVSEGEKGEIIITSLYNFAMPFIRYRIGDIGIYSSEQCPCGRTLPILKEVVGRSGDMITSPNGELIDPAYFFRLWGHLKGLRHAQLIQEKRDLLVLNLVVTEEFDRERSIPQLEEIYKKRMGDITLKVNYVDEISREKSGKYRMVKSKIPVEFGRTKLQ